MCRVDVMRPEKTTNFVGSVSDLKVLLAELPEEINGLEETYEVNQYHIVETGERWLEITPTK